MNLIKQKAEHIADYVDCSSYDDILTCIYKQIEAAARVCYKSEDLITEDSYEHIINILKQRGHHTPMSFGHCYLKYENNTNDYYAVKNFFFKNKYSKCVCVSQPSETDVFSETLYVSTNYQVLYETELNYLNDDYPWLRLSEFIRHLVNPDWRYHTKMYTFKLITNIGIANEIVRHGRLRACQESTRYCNYSKKKFSNQITYIIPHWFEDQTEHFDVIEPSNIYNIFSNEYYVCESYLVAQDTYFKLISTGLKPQDARGVLNKDTKTEIWVTGFEEDVDYFFSKRIDSAAHPQAQEIALLMKQDKKY